MTSLHVSAANRHPTLVAVLAPYAVSRALLVGLIVAIGLARRQSPLELWTHWDGKWYLGIAAHGYLWTDHGHPPLAFFPLYPLLIRLGELVGLPSIVAALLIANAALLGALLYVYHFIEAQWGSVAAHRALWLLVLFPTGFFFFAPYTESLLLLCAVAALYHARRGQAVYAGIWAAAAIVTRPTGLIVLPAILFTPVAHAGDGHPDVPLPGPITRAAQLVLPSIAALGAYLCYLQMERIPLAALLHAQRSWHRAFTAPWTGFTASVQWLMAHGTANLPWTAENLLQLGVTLLFLILTALAWPDLDRQGKIYCAGFWLIVLTSVQWLDAYYAPFSSMDRFVLALFPLAGWAAQRFPDLWARRWTIGGGVLMLGAATVHLAGGWVG